MFKLNINFFILLLEMIIIYYIVEIIRRVSFKQVYILLFLFIILFIFYLSTVKK
jgi:hypothetical protein